MRSRPSVALDNAERDQGGTRWPRTVKFFEALRERAAGNGGPRGAPASSKTAVNKRSSKSAAPARDKVQDAMNLLLHVRDEVYLKGVKNGLRGVAPLMCCARTVEITLASRYELE